MAKLDKNLSEQNETHEKGWGYELWIENIPEYCGKLLRFEAFKKTSLHYHVNKLETMYLAKGRINIDMIEPESGLPYTIEMWPGDTLKILPGHCHQIIALADSDLFEFSTMHEDSDSYRVKKGD